MATGRDWVRDGAGEALSYRFGALEWRGQWRAAPGAIDSAS